MLVIVIGFRRIGHSLLTRPAGHRERATGIQPRSGRQLSLRRRTGNGPPRLLSNQRTRQAGTTPCNRDWPESDVGAPGEIIVRTLLGNTPFFSFLPYLWLRPPIAYVRISPKYEQRLCQTDPSCETPSRIELAGKWLSEVDRVLRARLFEVWRKNEPTMQARTRLVFLRLPRSCAGVAHGIQLQNAIATPNPSTGGELDKRVPR